MVDTLGRLPGVHQPSRGNAAFLGGECAQRRSGDRATSKYALVSAVSAAEGRANATGVSVRNTAFTARRLFSAQATDNLQS